MVSSQALREVLPTLLTGSRHALKCTIIISIVWCSKLQHAIVQTDKSCRKIFARIHFHIEIKNLIPIAMQLSDLVELQRFRNPFV